MPYKRWTRGEIERVMPIEALLSDCGARDIVSKGDHWLMRSPFHEDRHPSMYMYKDTLHWEEGNGFVLLPRYLKGAVDAGAVLRREEGCP